MKKRPVVNPGTNKPAPEIKPLPLVKKVPNIAKDIERRLPAKYLPPPNTPGGPTITGNKKSYSAVYSYASSVPEFVEISHNLDANDVGLFLKDDNGDYSYLTSYDVVDSNTIKLYGIDRMNTPKFTVTVFADTGFVPVFNFE
jgi:hypothetical protein